MKYLVIICLIVFSFKTSAQERVITGRILDKATQEPIENVNITVQGTTSGSVSDSLGVFRINIKSNFKSLLVSHVSYQMVMVEIPASDKFRIELESIFVVIPQIILTRQPPELASLDSTNKERDNRVSGAVEQNAGFYGGVEYLNYYLTTNYKYPEGLIEFIRGGTYVSFDVDITGAVGNVKVRDDSLNITMQTEIKQLFSSMPNWQPAYQRGVPVTQKILVPIVYGPVSQRNEFATYLSYYLAKKIIYPTEAVRLAIEGTVYVYFSINSQQEFTSLEILQGIGSGCDEMVYNAIKDIPRAELKSLMLDIGDSVFVLPVDFRLDKTSIREDDLLKSTDAVFITALEVLATKPNNIYGQIMPTSEFYSLEGALKHINNATKLHITDRQLKSLSPEVRKLQNLTLINLENNLLQSLPAELADLLNLREVYAPQNKLSSLPLAMSEMQTLKIVGLADNSFTEFPEALLSLKRLRALDLNDNKISTIPATIGNLKHLKILLLRNNDLQDLPDELFKLKLDEINLQGNNLSEELIIKIKKSFKNASITL